MRKEINLQTGEITEHPDAPVTWDTSDKRTYGEKRASEYPPLAEQLDYIYHNGIEAWKTDMILPVKNKYPKGNE